ncbi:MAG: hypothetical protein M1818_000241 [Claussenomyces sp. TS43310]|nr:MAG: hypothetical protein M1818_000241 [Claussenomyces sp. TS43310]
MGNNPSTAARSTAASPPTSLPASSSSSRRDPKLRDSIQTQKPAPPEPTLLQARGTSISRRRRNTTNDKYYHAVHFDGQSASPKGSSPKDPQPKPAEKAPEREKAEVNDEPSKPVDVPSHSTNTAQEASSLKSPYSFSQLDGTGTATDAMGYHLTRPPRLPLPIQEELHSPGSPVIAPSDPDAPVPPVGELESETLPRRSSTLSSTTADDELEDDELPVDKSKAVVPTEFQWLGGGEKAYVTGTIFQWNRKAKLDPIPDRPGCFASTIYVRPGTHHVRFIVDGNMTISQDLPTTVDFGNNLVNYIEVSADDVPHHLASSKPEAMGPPVANEMKKLEGTATQQEAKATTDEAVTKPTPKTKAALPATRYTSQIPQYLLDLDKPDDTPAYQYAATAIEKLPTPPSLPGFLGKPILNAATPMKDDNSVLNMPNHTVLNHLATSSIKNNVLAVSATTRYKFKVCPPFPLRLAPF